MRFSDITVPDMFPQNSTMVELGGSPHLWFGGAVFVFTILHTFAQRNVAQGLWGRFTGIAKFNKHLAKTKLINDEINPPMAAIFYWHSIPDFDMVFPFERLSNFMFNLFDATNIL